MVAMMWLVAALVGAQNEGYVAAEVIRPSPLGGHCSRRLEVAGFSDNERAMAVLQHARCSHPDGSVDHFDLLDLIELNGRTVLATYQASPIVRTVGPHRPVFVPPATLRRDNPAWGRAQHLQEWVKLKRAGHFKARKHDFKDVLVRLRPDPDSPLDVRAEGTQLILIAPPPAPIGGTVMGRLTDGSEVPLGHVRDEAQAKGAERGSLQVLFSAHGHLVALVHHGLLEEAVTLTHTPKTEPFASTQVGFLQMLKWDADSVKALYKQMHPEGRKVWDEMIGDLE
jgi:hypothetical protein